MAALLDNNSTLNDVVDRVNEILSFNEAAGNGDVAGVVAGKACDVAYKNQANVTKCKAAEGRGGDK